MAFEYSMFRPHRTIKAHMDTGCQVTAQGHFKVVEANSITDTLLEGGMRLLAAGGLAENL